MSPFQTKQLDLMRQMELTASSGKFAPTIVAMRPDYAADNQLCLTSVSYLDSDLVRTIDTKLIQPLKRIDPAHYYYSKPSLHVTIQNIRVIANPPTYTAKDIDLADQLLQTIIPTYPSCTFVLQRLLMMPTSVSIIALVTPEYDRFVRTLRRKLVQSGIPDDKTYFTDEMVFANVTVCRYTHLPTQQFLDQLKSYRDTFFGNFFAKEISLVQTNAGAHPSKTKVFGTYKFR